MRKKKEFKDANRSGTSTKALEKTEKALEQYKFMQWMDGFIQPRDGRTNLKNASEKNDKEDNEKDEGHAPSPVEDDTMDNNPLSPQNTDEEVEDQEILPEREESFKPSKRKKQIQGAAKESLLEDMEFSLISKMNSRMSEREKRKQEKREDPKKGLDSEDVFCQALALDLKQLPMYERCIAKHELRNVVYKHQMACMERQMRPYGSYDNVNPNPPNNQIPPITATANNCMVSPLQQTSSSSFSSPPQTPMPQSQNSWLWEIEKQ